jgi:Na+/proline symporter
MGPAFLTLAPLLALDGESATGNNTAIAVIALVSMVACYLLLGGLWYFVFREKARSRRRGDPPE